MKYPLIVGLCGPKQAGKSTAVRELETRAVVWRHSFADPLKHMLQTLGVPDAALWGDDKEKPCDALGGITARHAMQTLGTEWGRLCMAQNFWRDAWLRDLHSRLGDAAPEFPDVIIADDARFVNEAKFIQSLGGVIICVVRHEGDFHQEPEHSSEDFSRVSHDFLIVNDETPEVLGDRFHQIVTQHAVGRPRVA